MTFHNAGSVLMLDDEYDIMSIFTLALERQGFHVIGFTEPLQALDHTTITYFSSCVITKENLFKMLQCNPVLLE